MYQTYLFAELKLDPSNYQRLFLAFAAHLRTITLFCTLWSIIASQQWWHNTTPNQSCIVYIQYCVVADLLIWNSPQGSSNTTLTWWSPVDADFDLCKDLLHCCWSERLFFSLYCAAAAGCQTHILLVCWSICIALTDLLWTLYADMSCCSHLPCYTDS